MRKNQFKSVMNVNNPADEGQQHSLNRRDFLQYVALAGTGVFLSPLTNVSAQESSDPEPLNIGMIGVGAQGQVLMNDILKLPNIRFKAVCDIWEDYNLRRAYRLLQKYGHELNAYVDYREMLAQESSELDAVIIASPDFWHARHAIDSLEAGLHVYCEKEMSNRLPDARRMVEAARRTGKLLQIGHQRRSNPRYRHCYEHLMKDAQLFGRITAVNGQWNRAVRPDRGWPKKAAIEPKTLQKYGYESMHQFRNWRWFRGLGGGPIVDLGSHQIDIFNWFLDAVPFSVMAQGATYYYEENTHEWYDIVRALYEYDTEHGPLQAHYQVITTNSNQGYYETFMGDEGTLLISEANYRSGIYPEPKAPEWEKWVNRGYITAPEEPADSGQGGGVTDVRETPQPPKYTLPVDLKEPYHTPHLRNFFNAIRGTDTLNCPPEIGYETAVTVLKVNEAVEAQKKLTFQPEDFHVAV